MANSPGDILKRYGQVIIDALRQSLEENGKVSERGLLKQSISFNVRVFATELVLEISMNDYWRWVDEGRRAGSKQPPIESMVQFIRARQRVFQDDIRKMTTKKNNKAKSLKNKTVKKELKQVTREKAEKQLAFVLARGIKKKGIKATNFVEEAFEGNVFTDLQNELSEALQRNILLNFDKVKSVEIK